MKKKNTKRNAVHRRNVGDQTEFINKTIEKVYEINPKKSPFGNTKTSRHTKRKSLKKRKSVNGDLLFWVLGLFFFGILSVCNF